MDTAAHYSTVDTNYFKRDYSIADTIVILEKDGPNGSIASGWKFMIYNDMEFGEEVLKISEIHPWSLASQYATVKYDIQNRIDTLFIQSINSQGYYFYYSGTNTRPDSLWMILYSGAGGAYRLHYHNSGAITDSISLLTFNSNDPYTKIYITHDENGYVIEILNDGFFVPQKVLTKYLVQEASTLTLKENVLEMGMYPNPTTGFLQIKSNPGEKKVKVTDAMGKVILSEIHYDSNITIDLNTHIAGIYYVFIESKGLISYERIELL